MVYPTETDILGKTTLDDMKEKDPSIVDDPEYQAQVARSWDPDTGLQYIEDVPAQTVCFFEFYSYKDLEDLDTAIDWGDGSPIQYLKDMEIFQLKDVPFDGNPAIGFTLVDEKGNNYRIISDEFDKSKFINLEYSEDSEHIQRVVYKNDEVTRFMTIGPDNKPSGEYVDFTIPANTEVTFDWNGDSDIWTYTASWNDNTNDKAMVFDYRDVNAIGNYLINASGNIYSVLHNYQSEGKYKVTIYSSDVHMVRGNYAYSFTVRNGSVQNLVCEVFGENLKFSRNIRNMSSFCGAATDAGCLRLQRLILPRTLIENLYNVTYMFQNCKNLIKVEGNSQNTFLQHMIRSVTGLFCGCSNLESVTNFSITPIIRLDDSDNTLLYGDCPKLSTDILKLLPSNGFISRYVAVNQWFRNCSSLTCSNWNKLGNILWNDTSRIFYKTSNTFTGCSDEFLKNVPATWGGKMLNPVEPWTINTVDEFITKNGLDIAGYREVDFKNYSLPSHYTVKDWTYVGKWLWNNTGLTASNQHMLFKNMPDDIRANAATSYGGYKFIAPAKSYNKSVNEYLLNNCLTPDYEGPVYFGNIAFPATSFIESVDSIANALWKNEKLTPVDQSKLFVNMSISDRVNIPYSYGGLIANDGSGKYVISATNPALANQKDIYFGNYMLNGDVDLEFTSDYTEDQTTLGVGYGNALNMLPNSVTDSKCDIESVNEQLTTMKESFTPYVGSIDSYDISVNKNDLLLVYVSIDQSPAVINWDDNGKTTNATASTTLYAYTYTAAGDHHITVTNGKFTYINRAQLLKYFVNKGNPTKPSNANWISTRTIVDNAASKLTIPIEYIGNGGCIDEKFIQSNTSRLITTIGAGEGEYFFKDGFSKDVGALNINASSTVTFNTDVDLSKEPLNASSIEDINKYIADQKTAGKAASIRIMKCIGRMDSNGNPIDTDGVYRICPSTQYAVANEPIEYGGNKLINGLLLTTNRSKVAIKSGSGELKFDFKPASGKTETFTVSGGVEITIKNGDDMKEDYQTTIFDVIKTLATTVTKTITYSYDYTLNKFILKMN